MAKEGYPEKKFTKEDMRTYIRNQCPNCGSQFLDKRTRSNGPTCTTEVTCNGCGLVFLCTYTLERIEFDGWLYGKAVGDVGRKVGRHSDTGSTDGSGQGRGSDGVVDSKTNGAKRSKLGSKGKVSKQGRKNVRAGKGSKERRKKTNSKV